MALRVPDGWEKYRVTEGKFSSAVGTKIGVFDSVPYPHRGVLTVQFFRESNPIEHVGIRARKRLPILAEIDWVVKLCWEDGDHPVMVFRADGDPVRDVAHLWRQVGGGRIIVPR